MSDDNTPLETLITNQQTERFFNRLGAMLGKSHDGKRSLYDICGYDESLAGTSGFRRMYAYSRRHGVANRITWGMAKNCWRGGFDIVSDPDDDTSSVIPAVLDQLKRAGLNRYLERADILNRIGRFSLLFVGVADGLPFEQPVGKVNGDGFKSLYFRAYAYDSVEIIKYDTEPTSRRFGLPVIYQVQRGAIRGEHEKDNSSTKALNIHFSRIVHLNENALDSEIEGMGALEPVFNRILDLDKACGGSAEAYFRNAKGKIAYEVDKEFAGALSDPTTKAAFNEGAEKYTNEFQDHTVATGAKVKTLPTPHASPLDTVKVLLWEVSAMTGLRIRVLTGEGAGQMAGSEDQLATNQLIMDRQQEVCAPWVDQVMMIISSAGMTEYKSRWAVLFPLQQPSTDQQKSDIKNKDADTLGKIMDALTSHVGDGLSVSGTLEAFGFGGIDFDDINADEGIDDDDSGGDENV